MASIHIIYDENDNVQIPPKTGLSYARLTLPEYYSNHEIEEVAKDLALMLLRHHFGHPK